MNIPLGASFLVALLGGTILAPGAEAPAPAANDLTAQYNIVVAETAPPSEHYAAEELQRYLEKMTGVKIPVATDTGAPSQHEIILGQNRHLESLSTRVDFAALGTDGFTLRTVGPHLIVAGGRPRGTLNGVYSLLEEKWGVRWFTPELEVVPKSHPLPVPALDETFIPPLEYREVFWTEMTRDANFAARHHLNGNHYRLTEKHGGRAVVYFPFVHSFDALIPRSLYQDHPEYFPYINGRRVDGYVQRCLSNPDVIKLAIATVRRWIQEHPEATVISVSQNDTGRWCQCDQCRALDEAEGSPSASIIRFVNTIAEDVEKDYPKVRLDTLAYQYSRKPPKTLRPRHNVIVRLCSIECCFAHPLETGTSPENRRFRDDILAWQPVAPLLYVWDYTPNFAHYQQPFPNFDVLQSNVRFFVGHGVKGLFEQGNYSAGGQGEMGPLRAYVLAELLWNPNTDVARHIREFTHAYYGKAAPKIRAYLEVLQRAAHMPGVHAHIYDPPTAAYLNEETMKEAAGLFDEAERLANDDAVRFRVRTARLPIWYVALATGRVQGESRKALLEQFLSVARKAGVSNISEGKSLDTWAKEMGGSGK
jgi:Domain of unknown function (DUF4838)/Glycosyl hydrolase family 67 N-terminus